MKLNSRRFSAEDFKDAPEYVINLLSALNQNLQELQAINTNGITINDNLYQEIIDLNFVNDSVAFPIKKRLRHNVLPKGIQVIYCVDSEGNTVSDYPWLNWSFSNQQLTVNAISNLTSNKTYLIRVLVIYG